MPFGNGGGFGGFGNIPVRGADLEGEVAIDFVQSVRGGPVSLNINGESVKKGAEETFKRNLTEANRESKDLSFEMYNSLSHNGCGSLGSDANTPAPWLSEIRVFPAIYYLDLANCENRMTTQINFTPKNFDLVNLTNIDDIRNNASMPFSYHNGTLNDKPNLKARIKYIAQTLSLYNDTYRFILGVEKNPWCQAYVGAKASSKPKIPFAPEDVTLTASAYAKQIGRASCRERVSSPV